MLSCLFHHSRTSSLQKKLLITALQVRVWVSEDLQYPKVVEGSRSRTKENAAQSYHREIISGYTKNIKDNKITTLKFTSRDLEEMLRELFKGWMTREHNTYMHSKCWFWDGMLKLFASSAMASETVSERYLELLTFTTGYQQFVECPKHSLKKRHSPNWYLVNGFFVDCFSSKSLSCVKIEKIFWKIKKINLSPWWPLSWRPPPHPRPPWPFVDQWQKTN